MSLLALLQTERAPMRTAVAELTAACVECSQAPKMLYHSLPLTRRNNSWT